MECFAPDVEQSGSEAEHQLVPRLMHGVRPPFPICFHSRLISIEITLFLYFTVTILRGSFRYEILFIKAT